VAVSQPVVSGKFLEIERERFLVKGVSYGTFTPNADGSFFPEADRVASDFKAIARLGANTVRTYTPPSLDLLDEALRHDLRVVVGVPWPQHIAFLDSQRSAAAIRADIRRHVERLASHPATLLFALGNEIPPGVVRWYGRRTIERFLSDLCDEARAASPDSLFTYVNYPPTEYLETPFFDVCAFNVFLHREADLSAYLARLHNVAGPRPLLVSEAGADSLRHGEDRQAALVMMQLRTAFSEGACGAIVFSWTDDWWRGGQQVNDWAFGLVDSARRPKRSFSAVQRVFESAPFHEDQRATWPRVSVVVCAYNAEQTIDDCLTSIGALNYPDTEIIVIDDGSTDRTAAIAARHARVQIVRIANGGLAAARNVGLRHATGDIVAYTDADVRVDRDWLTYLVQPFLNSSVVAAGGPNVVPADDPWMAQCVARAPGGPTHVLLDDRVAEHVPGCNCAFRRDALMAIGGFNPIYLRAGDDVDVCWRLQAKGWKIGYAPSALVWHHHRASVRAYWRQQVGYGEGETWLMRQHPRQFARGRAAWRGHIYSSLPLIRSFSEERIHGGPFGSAAFPSVYRTYAHPLTYLPHSGRWQLGWMLLFASAALAVGISPALAGTLAAAALTAVGATAIKCLRHGLRSDIEELPPIGRYSRSASRAGYRLTIVALHFLQPLARLHGRLKGIVSAPPDLGPAADRNAPAPVVQSALSSLADGIRLTLGRSVERLFWSERWIEARTVLCTLADRVRQQRIVRNVELDTGWWEDRDATIVDHAWLRLDVRALVEDHGSGKCLCRVVMRPRMTATPLLALASGIVVIAVLGRADLIAWSPGASLIGFWTMALTVVHMTVSSRVVTSAMNGLEAELGLLPLSPDRDRSSAPAPGARTDTVAPPIPETIPAPTPLLATAHHTTVAARIAPREAGVSAALADEPTAVRVRVMHRDETKR
jgi:GT2 family glycosyltransferase